MMRKFILFALLCIGLQNIAGAQAYDSVTIYMPPYTDTSCPGTQLEFWAVQSNDTLTATTYQWYTNGFPTGVTIDTFYSTALDSGSTVYCEIYYTDTLGNTDSFMSNVITIAHIDTIVPQVFIALTTGNNPDCGGHPLTFTATPDNGGSAPVYQWFINDSAVAGADTTTFSGVFSGGDSISCRMISNSPCAPYDTAYSNVIPVLHYNLTAGVTVTAAYNPVCAGALDTFTASLVNEGSGYSVAWYIDTSTVPSALGTSFVTDSLDSGALVYCILTAPDSCILNHITLSNVITVDVIANLPSAASIAITSGTNPGCLDSPVVFTATYSDFGTAPTTVWYVNGLPRDYNSTTLDTFFQNGDIVSFQINETDNGCYTSDSIIVPSVILVRDSTPVTPLISLIGNELIANTAGTYTWYGPDTSTHSPIPGAITQTYHPLTLGYYYAIRDTNNCPSLPSNVMYISLLEVKTINNSYNITVYPNPTSGILNMDFGKAADLQLTIYNMSGQAVKEETILNEKIYQADLSALAAGNYMIVLSDGAGVTNTIKVSLSK